MREVVEKTADACFMPLTVGGGIRKVGDVRAMLLAGADKVSMNTAALDEPDLVNASADGFGSQCVVVAIDARRDGRGGWIVHTHGGRRPTQWQAVDWAVEVSKRGAGEILLTSMDSDGTKKGYDLELTAAVGAAVDIPVIASGGAGDIRHMAEVLTAGKADAVLAASIFHFGDVTIAEVKDALAAAGLPVRPLTARASG
jgi:cyclase